MYQASEFASATEETSERADTNIHVLADDVGENYLCNEGWCRRDGARFSVIYLGWKAVAGTRGEHCLTLDQFHVVRMCSLMRLRWGR